MVHEYPKKARIINATSANTKGNINDLSIGDSINVGGKVIIFNMLLSFIVFVY